MLFSDFEIIGILRKTLTTKASRITENLESLSFRMIKKDLEEISKLDKNYRFGSSLNWFDFDTFA